MAETILKTAAALYFLPAVGHLPRLFRLDAAFRLYRIDPFMERLAACWSPLPALITLGIACCLAVCGLYALSAAGTIRPLPLLRPAVYAIGSLFLLRALGGAAAFIRNGTLTPAELAATIIAGTIGTLYLAGGIRTTQTPRS